MRMLISTDTVVLLGQLSVMHPPTQATKGLGKLFDIYISHLGWKISPELYRRVVHIMMLVQLVPMLVQLVPSTTAIDLGIKKTVGNTRPPKGTVQNPNTSLLVNTEDD